MPLLQRPETNTTRAVMVQTTKVSTNTSKMPISPCLTGWSTFAVECIIGAVPQPASLLYTERASPVVMARDTVAPANPPTAAVGVNAFAKIPAITEGTTAIFFKMITTPPPR